MLSRASVAKFQQIYFQEYGINIDEQTAYELANNLANLYRSVYLPDTKNISQKYETNTSTQTNQN
ncbi:MAG: hypothetical protein ABI425_04440 [Patescibacteria group bacterium]